MIFKGTPTRPVGSIDRLVEGLGGTSNAYTSYDYVHFDVVLPAREIRAGIDLLADVPAVFLLCVVLWIWHPQRAK